MTMIKKFINWLRSLFTTNQVQVPEPIVTESHCKDVKEEDCKAYCICEDECNGKTEGPKVTADHCCCTIECQCTADFIKNTPNPEADSDANDSCEALPDSLEEQPADEDKPKPKKKRASRKKKAIE